MFVLGEGLTQGLDDTATTEETKYFINFNAPKKEFCLNLHYNGTNSVLYVIDVKTYQSKAKDSEIKPYPLCLGNISKDFTNDYMKKSGLNEYVYEYVFADFNTLDVNDFADIRKCLMKKNNIK